MIKTLEDYRNLKLSLAGMEQDVDLLPKFLPGYLKDWVVYNGGHKLFGAQVHLRTDHLCPNMKEVFCRVLDIYILDPRNLPNHHYLMLPTMSGIESFYYWKELLRSDKEKYIPLDTYKGLIRLTEKYAHSWSEKFRSELYGKLDSQGKKFLKSKPRYFTNKTTRRPMESDLLTFEDHLAEHLRRSNGDVDFGDLRSLFHDSEEISHKRFQEIVCMIEAFEEPSPKRQAVDYALDQLDRKGSHHVRRGEELPKNEDLIPLYSLLVLSSKKSKECLGEELPENIKGVVLNAPSTKQLAAFQKQPHVRFLAYKGMPTGTGSKKETEAIVEYTRMRFPNLQRFEIYDHRHQPGSKQKTTEKYQALCPSFTGFVSQVLWEDIEAVLEDKS